MTSAAQRPPETLELSFSIDRGGTFTDVYCEIHDGVQVRLGFDRSPRAPRDPFTHARTHAYSVVRQTTTKVLKLLSEDPENYPDAPREGIRRFLESELGVSVPRSDKVPTGNIRSIRMGTTVATNALLERQGERTALVVTKGFRDLLHIANQSRPNIFDLEVRMPENLYEEVVEVDEEVGLPLRNGPARRSGGVDSDWYQAVEVHDVGSTESSRESVAIRRPVDVQKLETDLKRIKDKGITSLAVVLKHSALFPDHERLVGEVAQGLGFEQVSLSSTVMPMVKMVPRGFTASADAYLTPHILKYIRTFMEGFDDGLSSKTSLYFMQSDGGLTDVGSFSGHRAILSGPAGGYVGYALTTPASQTIGFDMGGTSTDVSRFAESSGYSHVFECTTAGVTIQAPQLDINTVAAGGGSRLFYESGVFRVGPESAGSHPVRAVLLLVIARGVLGVLGVLSVRIGGVGGFSAFPHSHTRLLSLESSQGPVCYRKNGHLAITDANVVLGRVLPEFFPKIFGKNEDEMLDKASAVAAMAAIADRVNADASSDSSSATAITKKKSVEDVAMGFVKVANEAMCRPIRALTQMRGYDVSKHTLACFGGAGGQHACAIARNLGMRTIYVHRYSGVLSAVGIGLADVCVERQHPVNLGVDCDSEIQAGLRELEGRVRAELATKGFSEDRIELTHYLNLRYDGTDVAIMCSVKVDEGVANASTATWTRSFLETYQREFGFRLDDRKILVDDLRVRGVGKVSRTSESEGTVGDRAQPPEQQSQPPPPATTTTSVYFEPLGLQPTAVYILSDLASTMVSGPAIVIDDISTIVVEPGCTARVDAHGNVTITLEDVETVKVDETREDPVQLAVFSHRFMSIAEQMGRVLQRTSISVNIKERLDFSCALFDRDGNLVSNAPHLPVHLGAMSEAVKYQIKHYAMGPQDNGGSIFSTTGSPQTSKTTERLREGDVIISNHPQLAGGSHLPDITAITPVFDGGELVFFVASRGHHADIGGISPGSMPPNSRTLSEEGIAIVSFKVVDAGVFDDTGLRRILAASRNIEDNISDLRAQIAANNCGILLVRDLIAEYGLPVVGAYMEFIQRNAERAVRDMLREFAGRFSQHERHSTIRAEDRMDDGTPICLEVTIDPATASAVFDFTGTGPQVFGNTNAPPAVVHSAIIYALRAMLDKDIPLNHGCMKPVTITIPRGSLLDPAPDAAVVGGNVLTSQRVTDVILSAFNAAAPSQGCMNNLTFGDDNMGYYETIAGGAGAGPGWHGRSGVHTHMTNTRITDPEILERRYPVAVKSFSLRPGSGGDGRWRGGDGVVRELEFLRPLTVSILSERRCIDVPGLLGGGHGSRGRNILLKRTGGTDQTDQMNGSGSTSPGGRFEATRPLEPPRELSLGGKATVEVEAGDVLRIESPGGGGYGLAPGGEEKAKSRESSDAAVVEWMIARRKDGMGLADVAGTGGSVHEYERRQLEA